MARRVDWSRQSRSDLKKLSKQAAHRVQRAVRRFAGAGEGSVEHLKGFDSPTYRLRVGDWRVRFCYEEVGTDELGISVERVLHRRQAYRKSALARQGIPDNDGFEESDDWETHEEISN